MPLVNNVPDVTQSANGQSMANRIDPGLIDIEACVIIGPRFGSIIVTNLVLDIVIYEDIMSPFITGKVTLSDSVALNNALPFIGEELLYLELRTPGFEGPQYVRSGMFSLYKMETRENIKLKNVGYTLRFTAIEAVTDVNQKISSTFRGKISDTVKKLIESAPGLSSQKDPIIESTTNAEIYTSNFWTPTQNLYFLTTRALNSYNNPSYVFFENNEGFIFASIDALFSKPTRYQFIRDSKMRTVEAGASGEAAKIEPQNIDEEYQKILDMSIPVMYDYFERVQSGYYGSRVYHYDIETKRLNVRNLIAKEDLKKVQLNKHLLISENLQFTPEALMLETVIHRNLFTGSPQVSIDHHNKRAALLAQVEGLKVNIRVFGKVNYSVGNVVEITVYKDESTDKKSPAGSDIDEILSGKYLITAISHEISRENHYCNIELCKDSVIKDLNKRS